MRGKEEKKWIKMRRWERGKRRREERGREGRSGESEIGDCERGIKEDRKKGTKGRMNKRKRRG